MEKWFDSYDKYKGPVILESVYQSKIQELQNTLDVIVTMSNQRLSIRDRNHESIEKEILKARNLALNINPFSKYSSMFSEHLESLETGFEREIIGLEREKRQEDAAAWRDIILLKNDLLSLLKDLSRTSGKISLLEKIKMNNEKNGGEEHEA